MTITAMIEKAPVIGSLIFCLGGATSATKVTSVTNVTNATSVTSVTNHHESECQCLMSLPSLNSSILFILIPAVMQSEAGL